MASPLAGAWELVSDTDQGVIVFTESHYSGVVMSKNSKRSDSSEPTPQAGLEVLPNVISSHALGECPERGEDLVRQRISNRVTENEAGRGVRIIPDCECCFQVRVGDRDGAVQQGVHQRQAHDLRLRPRGHGAE